MIGMNLKAVQSRFFDRPKVKRSMDAASHRALSRFGAFVRTKAISSMFRHPVRRGFGVKSKVRSMAGSSRPGQPPFVHLGLIVKFLFFQVEGSSNVVIGPVPTNAKGGPQAMSALEKGGKSKILQRGRARSILVRKRPFMNPAFQEELSKAPHLWHNQLRG